MSSEYHRPPIRVALLGLGRTLFFEHYPLFKAHPSLFKIVAACDLAKERRDRIEVDFPDCKMFRQFRDMLDEPDIDTDESKLLLRDIQSESQWLLRMVENLLSVTKIEGSYSAHKEIWAAEEIMGEVAGKIRKIYPDFSERLLHALQKEPYELWQKHPGAVCPDLENG